jgi:hypothetical protein
MNPVGPQSLHNRGRWTIECARGPPPLGHCSGRWPTAPQRGADRLSPPPQGSADIYCTQRSAADGWARTTAATAAGPLPLGRAATPGARRMARIAWRGRCCHEISSGGPGMCHDAIKTFVANSRSRFNPRAVGGCRRLFNGGSGQKTCQNPQDECY